MGGVYKSLSKVHSVRHNGGVMSDEDKKTAETTEDKAKVEEADAPATLDNNQDIGDDDLAEALGDEGAVEAEINIDEAIADADPDFKKELEGIDPTDFDGVKINKENASDEVSENVKVPSMFKAFIQNLPKERKRNIVVAGIVVVTMVPLGILVMMGKILPTFELPYLVSLHDLTSKVTTYPLDGVRVPLFDDYRTNSFTVPLPKTTINLKTNGSNPSFGEFEFFLNLRDKDLASAVEVKQSEIIDLIQRALEEVTLGELETPIGKERVKKVLRHRINEYMQGNVVLGVYYRSVILTK